MTRNPWWLIAYVLALAVTAGVARAQEATAADPEPIPAPKCCSDVAAPCPDACPAGCGSAACPGCAATSQPVQSLGSIQCGVSSCAPNPCTAGCEPCGAAAAVATGAAKCKCCEDCKCGANCSCSKKNHCCGACNCGKPNASCVGCCPAGVANCCSEGCCPIKTKKCKHNHAIQPVTIFVPTPLPIPGAPMMPPAAPMMMPPNPGIPAGIPVNYPIPPSAPVGMSCPATLPCPQMMPPPLPPRPAANVWVLRAVETSDKVQTVFTDGSFGPGLVQVNCMTGKARLEMQSADAKAICESMTLTCTTFGAPLQLTAVDGKVVIAGSCIQATCDTLTNMGPDCGVVLKGNVTLKYSQGDLKGEVKCDNAALDFAHGTLKLEGCVCLKHVKGDTQAQVKCQHLIIGLEDGKLEVKPSPAP